MTVTSGVNRLGLIFSPAPTYTAPMATLTRLFPLLKQLGLDDQKAQEFIETIEKGLIEHVATKADLEKMRADLEKMRADLEKMKADLSVRIESTKTDLLRWLFGAWATLFLAILALFFKFP
ncbi:MAG: hypothetical protein D6704_08265 [Nitrospirae bacterium]|nr:MAG: hypothetical protein D6704_08265 [Nitrospirota bacterium]